MAGTKGITAPQLLRKYVNGSPYYSGTRDELIAAGVARDGDFPGDPSSGCHTTHAFQRDGRRVSISVHSRVASPITFWVCLGLTEEQHRKWREKQERLELQKRRSAKRDVDAVRTAVEKVVSQWPRDEADYIARIKRALDLAIGTFVRPLLQGREPGLDWYICPGGGGGYRIDAESGEAFEDAIREAGNALCLARASVDRSSRNFALAKIHGNDANVDPQFGTFMHELTRKASRAAAP